MSTVGVTSGSKLITADEVAELLQVPKSWVYRACREGALPAVRCGRYVRFDPADIERWIDDQKGAVDHL
ncbi:MAG: helix-turn-helix domain-containing protein [Solirubrobacterales bacterium]